MWKSQINRDRTSSLTSGEERPSTEKHCTSFTVSVEDLFGGKETSQDILAFASTSVARHKFLSFILPPLSFCL